MNTMEILYMNYYDVSYDEASFEITIKPLSRAAKTYRLFERVIVFFLIPLILMSIATFLSKTDLFIIFIGIFFLSVGICLILIDIKNENNRNKKFRLIVNDTGVTHSDLKKNFHLDWSEVNSFGIVNRLRMSNSFGILGMLRSNRRYGSQTVLYFSNKLYNDKELLRRNLAPKPSINLCQSTHQMIVFEFQEDDIEQEIREKLYPYIHKYCDADKELSFIETAPWV